METRTRFKQILQKSLKIGHSLAWSSSQLHLRAINCKLQAISNQLVIRYLLDRKGSGVMPGHKRQGTQQLLCTCEEGLLGQLEAGILCNLSALLSTDKASAQCTALCRCCTGERNGANNGRSVYSDGCYENQNHSSKLIRGMHMQRCSLRA